MTRRASNGKPSARAAILKLPATDAAINRADDQLQQEIVRLVEASHDGRLSERGRTDRLEGNNRKVLEGVNEMLDAILLPIGEGNRVLAQISAGKIDELITRTYKGDHEKMKLAVNSLAIAQQHLLTDTAMVTKAAAEGRLNVRSDVSKHQGAYRKIVEGINHTLDTIVEPLKATAENASTLASSSGRTDGVEPADGG